MRDDIAKVIVERPRRDHGAAYPRAKQEARARDPHAAPMREAMGLGYSVKELNENLQPLVRYIGRQVGRPWRLVYADISRNLSVRCAVQKHVLDHLREIVVESVWLEGKDVFCVGRFLGVRRLESRGSWPRYYVCPKSGLLRVAPRRRKAAVAPADSDRRVIDSIREFRRLAGIWFEVVVGEIPVAEDARIACFDVLERRTPERPGPFDGRNRRPGEPKLPVLWQAGRYAISKRQLSKRELRLYDLAKPKPR